MGHSGLHQKTESDDSCGTDELLLVSLFATSPPAIRYHDTCTDGAQCQDRCLRGGGGGGVQAVSQQLQARLGTYDAPLVGEERYLLVETPISAGTRPFLTRKVRAVLPTRPVCIRPFLTQKVRTVLPARRAPIG